MTIEILCSECSDCSALVGKVCQAVSDLNLDAQVVFVDTPHPMGHYALSGHTGVLIDGQPVAAGGDCSVLDLIHLIEGHAHPTLK